MGQGRDREVFNPKYPSISDLKKRARKRMPRFAFDYLEGGCNEDVNLARNRSDIRCLELEPHYLRDYGHSSFGVTLWGVDYDAPFGIAPVGLQGLMWPGSPEILAKAAFDHRIPFILSTVTTSSVERIAEITEGEAWFQLYYPREEDIRNDILRRAEAAQCQVLVVLADVPTFGYRPRDIRSGLAMPPSMSLRNILQMTSSPSWLLRTLAVGKPQFMTLKPYIPAGLSMKKLGAFMDQTFDGRLTEARIAPIRDRWKGKLVIKGVVSEKDAEKAIRLGADGIIVSNHGGRQLDAGQSSIRATQKLAATYGDRIFIMMDGGIRSGSDIARCMAAGARFTFMGRPFMYGVGALGRRGGDHTIAMLKTQLKQIMEQLGCERPDDLSEHLIRT